MDSHNKKLIAFTFVVIIISAGIAMFMMDNSKSPKSGVVTSLVISEPPPLNKTANVTFSFSALFNLSNDSNLRAEIVFPSIYGDGFEWIGEQPKWRGSLMKGDEIKINGTFKSAKIGNWTIAAIVFWASSDNYSIKWGTNYDGVVYPLLNESTNVSGAICKVIYISVSETNSTICIEPFPEYKKIGVEYPEVLPPFMTIKSIASSKSWNFIAAARALPASFGQVRATIWAQ
jgi:hypothetical protein